MVAFPILSLDWSKHLHHVNIRRRDHTWPWISESAWHHLAIGTERHPSIPQHPQLSLSGKFYEPALTILISGSASANRNRTATPTTSERALSSIIAALRSTTSPARPCEKADLRKQGQALNPKIPKGQVGLVAAQAWAVTNRHYRPVVREAETRSSLRCGGLAKWHYFAALFA